jgi:alginate O-acetyltransferase complex protein AlgI
MLFTSITFFAVLALVSSVFYVTPEKWRVWYLLVISYIFYAISSHLYVLLLLASSAITYGAAIAIVNTEVEKRKILIMSACIGMLVGVLVVFKVSGVLHGILLPLGISYYSFKLVGYVIEVYWNDRAVIRDPARFFLYPVFFPQTVSGPIQRSADFFKQLQKTISQKADFDNIEQGFRLILGGLLMKLLVADRLSTFINIVDDSPQQYKWSVIATVVVCYTLQLYADFSGYTNIALGIGKLFGINGPRNFNAPFAAATIPQMWQRWHMSLTSWVTDYLFTPLNMGLRGLGRAGLLSAITINMVVIGLWHGLTPNFLVFGVLHAIFTIATVLTVGLRNKIYPKTVAASKVRLVLGVLLTFALMTFSMIFWHTGTWAAAITHFDLVFGLRHGGALGFDSIRTDAVEPLIPCMLIAYYVGLGAPGMNLVRKTVDRLVPNWVQYGFFILLISALSLESGTSFVYGQF